MQARTINKPLLKSLIKREHGGRTKLAKAIDVSPNTVSNWLRPDYDWGLEELTAKRAAKFLKVAVNTLFPPRANAEMKQTA